MTVLSGWGCWWHPPSLAVATRGMVGGTIRWTLSLALVLEKQKLDKDLISASYVPGFRGGSLSQPLTCRLSPSHLLEKQSGWALSEQLVFVGEPGIIHSLPHKVGAYTVQQGPGRSRMVKAHLS